MPEKKIEAYLHEHIPISKAMGIHVTQASKNKVVLAAPFANNINHKQTVFGGSLHAVATLACWSLLYVNLSQEPVQIVIAKSEINYIAPVDADFTVECLLPEKESWDKFIKQLDAKGKARIQLSAQIHHKERLCVDYQGIFVALRK